HISFFFSSRRRHTRFSRDWSSDVCSSDLSVVDHHDEREVARLDFEWSLGNHLLRFGVDTETMTTDRTTFYPGPTAQRYTIYSYRSEERRVGKEGSTGHWTRLDR